MIILEFDTKGEYVVDTSVIYSTIEAYPEEMADSSSMTHDELVDVRDRCFDIISSLEKSFIAIDDEGRIYKEYNNKVFLRYSNEYPTQWYIRMVECDRVKTKEVSSVDKTILSRVKRKYGLSPADCQFVFTSSRTNKRILLHRDSDYCNASGFINKHYKVKQIHVLKEV